MEARKPNAAAANDILHIIGPSEDELVAAIHKTGATKEEVLEAFQWLEGEDPGKTSRKKLTGAVKRVYDLLLEDRENREQDER